MSNSECSDVLKEHLLDKLSYSDSTDIRYLYASRFSQSSWEETKSELDAGLDVIFEDIGLNSNISESNFKKWQSDVRKSLDIEEVQKHSTSIMLSSATPDMIEAWSACMTSRKNYGAQILLEVLQNDRALLKINWLPNPHDPTPPKIESVYIDGATILDGIDYLAEDTQIEPEKIVTLEINREESHILISINTSYNSTTAYLPKKVELPKVPVIAHGRIRYLRDYTSGNWREIAEVPQDALPVAGMAGVVVSGPVVYGGADRKTGYYLNDYHTNRWHSLPRPPFEIFEISGDNSYGIIATGGEDGRQIAYLREFNSGNWAMLPRCPFEPVGLTGENQRGPVIFGGKGGREVAFISNYSSASWNQPSSPAPYGIVGAAGDNSRGIVAFGGPNRDRVFYLRNYAGSWEELPRAPISIKEICGNNSTGPIISGSTTGAGADALFFMRDYSNPAWKELSIAYRDISKISGHNSTGTLLLTESQ